MSLFSWQICNSFPLFFKQEEMAFLIVFQRTSTGSTSFLPLAALYSDAGWCVLRKYLIILITWLPTDLRVTSFDNRFSRLRVLYYKEKEGNVCKKYDS